MTAITLGSLITRRSIFIGAAASLVCASAIVRIASLMPVRGLILPVERPLGTRLHALTGCDSIAGAREFCAGRQSLWQ